MGDSVTECFEVDEPLRFPHLVQTRLHMMGLTNVMTANAGIRGHTTQDALNLLINHAAYRSTQMAVMLYNINDYTYLLERGRYTVVPSRFRRYSLSETARSVVEGFRYIGRTVTYHSNILFLCRGVFERLKENEAGDPIDVSSVPHDDAVLDAFRTNIRLAIGVCRTLNIQPVLVTQPSAITSELLQKCNDMICQVGMEQDVMVIDVARSFPEDCSGLFFPDRVHLNNEGSIAVADAVAPQLRILLDAEVAAKGESRSAPIEVVGSLSERRAFALDAIAEAVSPSASSKIEVVSFPLVRGSVRYPTTSVDGRYLLFQAGDADGTSICYLDDVLTNLVYLSSGEDNASHPRFFAGDAQVLCVTGDEECKHLSLLKVSLPKMVSTVTMSENLCAGIPCPDRDAQRAVFAGWTRDEHGMDRGATDLYYYDFETEAVTAITSTAYEEWRPICSPDGLSLYYIANPHGQFDVFRRTRGHRGDPEVVYASSADEWDPCLSPDGRLLVCASRAKGNWDLVGVDLNSGHSVFLTESQNDEYDPWFDPTGRILLFAVKGPTEGGIYGMYVERRTVDGPGGGTAVSRVARGP